MAARKSQYIILTAKSEKGKRKIAHHGEKWIFLEETPNLKFIRTPGPWMVVRSRDGSKVIFFKKIEDPDINYRMI